MFKRVPLCELAIKITDGSHFSPTPVENGRLIANVKDMQGGSVNLDSCTKISEKDYSKLAASGCIAEKNDVLLSKDGTVGKVAIVDDDSHLATLSSIAIIRITEQASHRYIGQFLRSEDAKKQYDNAMSGSALRRLVLRDINTLKIPTPPRVEQKLIARILDTLDTQVQKTEALISKLEKVKEGLLHDLVTRGIDENGRLRPSPEQAPERYKESPLGLIPREWSVGSLGDLSEIVSGVTLGGKSGSSAWPMVPYLRVANVQDGYLDLADIKLIRVSPADIDKYRLLPGDVLMNEGGDFDKLGRGALWQGQIDICLHQNHVFRVRTIPSVLNPHFLAAFSSSAAGKRYFIRSSKQSTNLASINSTQLKAFQVPLPSSDEQILIVKDLQAMASRIESEKALLDKLITQKSGLMDNLLTGRVRVTPLLELEQAQGTTPA
jgi:type I restriction enzyme S subunit